MDKASYFIYYILQILFITIYKLSFTFSLGSTLKLLYVTPERLAKSKRFMSNLQKCYAQKHLDRIAIGKIGKQATVN